MIADLLRRALERREGLLARLHEESTDCYRLLHGASEGRPGLAIDRYGPVLLLQTWREPLEPSEVSEAHGVAERALGVGLAPVWRHRGGGEREGSGVAPNEPVGTEMGLRFDVTPIHRGQDPLLFLDLRAGRRWVRERSRGARVLNLFAYTGGVTVGAAAGGADCVWHVDFARSATGWTRRNLALNRIEDDRVRLIEEDVFPVVRQLAGLPVKGRGARARSYVRLERQSFDVVVLDPPTWSKGAFGAVDIVRDYPSLLKPALLAVAPGGSLLVTNHAPSVSFDAWTAVLTRTGTKCGRPLRRLTPIAPEPDFPSFDDQPPLKMAWLELE